MTLAIHNVNRPMRIVFFSIKRLIPIRMKIVGKKIKKNTNGNKKKLKHSGKILILNQ